MKKKIQAQLTINNINEDDVINELDEVQDTIIDYMYNHNITEFEIKTTTVPTTTPDNVECTGYNFYVLETYKSGETKKFDLRCD